MSISQRGLTTLKDLELYDQYRSILVPKYGRAVHLKDGQVLNQYYGANEEAIYTINRTHFNCYLRDACVETGKVKFFFNHQLENLNADDKILTISTGERIINVNYSYLFGCDGTFSCVRNEMVRQEFIEASLSKLVYKFKEIYIPAKNGEYALDPNYVHIWNIAELLFVALPDGKKAFNGTLFFTDSSEVAKLQDRDKLFQFLDENCHLLSFIQKEQFIKEFYNNPELWIYEVKCSKWNYNNEILLMGDAAHSMPPFYAMGMNTCMETVRTFVHLIDEFKGNIGKAINEFTDRRIADTEAMKMMANKNYEKLRKCHHEEFDQKWNEAYETMRKSNGLYTTEYFQVAFTNNPFSSIVETETKVLEKDFGE
jgi:kynurenine 3-monooxygenase